LRRAFDDGTWRDINGFGEGMVDYRSFLTLHRSLEAHRARYFGTQASRPSNLPEWQSALEEGIRLAQIKDAHAETLSSLGLSIDVQDTGEVEYRVEQLPVLTRALAGIAGDLRRDLFAEFVETLSQCLYATIRGAILRDPSEGSSFIPLAHTLTEQLRRLGFSSLADTFASLETLIEGRIATEWFLVHDHLLEFPADPFRWRMSVDTFRMKWSHAISVLERVEQNRNAHSLARGLAVKLSTRARESMRILSDASFHDRHDLVLREYLAIAREAHRELTSRF
jgi:hypothetical protein